MQRALLQYRNPKNYDLVYEALVKAGREDLIGFDPKALIRPKGTKGGKGKPSIEKNNSQQNKNKKNRRG